LPSGFFLCASGIIGPGPSPQPITATLNLACLLLNRYYEETACKADNFWRINVNMMSLCSFGPLTPFPAPGRGIVAWESNCPGMGSRVPILRFLHCVRMKRRLLSHDPRENSRDTDGGVGDQNHCASSRPVSNELSRPGGHPRNVGIDLRSDFPRGAISSMSPTRLYNTSNRREIR
jgi:hypothetical protein